MPIDLNIDEEDCSVPAEVQIALYRITQEALDNMVKHARASQAEVRLACDAGQVKLIVADNGVGFNPQSVTSHRLGLDIMRERARYSVQPLRSTANQILARRFLYFGRKNRKAEQMGDKRSHWC